MSETRMPTQKRSIEKRNKIIESGFNLICNKGYYNVNTNEIASDAGVSVGILYQYFNDKKEIFIEGIKNYSANIMYPMVNVFETEKVDLKKLDILLDHMIDGFIKTHNKNQKAHNELSAMEHSDSDVAKILEDEEIKTTTKLCNILRNNGLSIDNLDEKMHICYRMIDEYCHEVIYHKHDNLNYDVMKKVIINSVIDILNKNL